MNLSKRQKTQIALAVAPTLALGAALARAQVVTVGYQFTNDTFNPTTQASNLTASAFSYVNANPGYPPDNNPPFIVQGGTLPDDPPYFVAQGDWFPAENGMNEDYYQFNVSVGLGYNLNVSSFSFLANSRQQVPFLTQIAYATNANFSNPTNFDANPISISTAESWNPYTASDAPILEGTGTYYFRVYNELDPSGNGTISDLLNMGNFALNGSVQAATAPTNLYWDPAMTAGLGSGGSGTWLGGKTWADGADYAWNNSVNLYANFGGSAGTVALGGNVTASGGITFATSGYELTGTAGQILTVGGTLQGNNTTINCQLTTPGPGTLLVVANVLTIGGNATLATGTDFAIDNGTVDIAPGGSIIADGASQDIAQTSGETAGLTVQNGGSYSTDSTLNVADPGGDAQLNVAGSLSAAAINLDSGTGTGVVNLTGGIITAGSVLVASGTSSIGIVTLAGGTLAVASILGGGGTSTFIFSGGTLQTIASGANLFAGIQSLQIQGGGTINTAGNNVTLAQAFTSTSGTFTKSGTGTLLINSSSGITSDVNVAGGTLEFANNTTLSAPLVTIGAGAVLEYNYNNRVLQPTTTYNGSGTLAFIGGNPTFGPGIINVDFSAGALIDVLSGELTGSSSYGGFWTQNQASLNIAAGATFDAVESGPTGAMQIDALTGAGTFQGGYEFNGSDGLSTVTIGVAGGSGLFSGNFLNDFDARLGIVKTGSGTETFTGTNSYAGGTTVNAGELVFGSHGSLPTNSSVKVTGGGLQLASGIGAEIVNSLSISGSGIVDLTNNPLFINYGVGNSSPIASIRSYLTTGYNGGAWNGAGIVSSTAAALNSSQKALVYSVGYADGADGQGIAPSGEIEILPTLAGDAKLQGNVVFGDFQVLAQYFGKSGGWDEGNFTYGSTVDFGDFQLLAQDFGFNSSALTSGELASINSFAAPFGAQLAANSNGVGFQVISVPEPAAATILILASASGLRRRRRHRLALSHA
jgi:autotransporter-associated beta strand protein